MEQGSWRHDRAAEGRDAFAVVSEDSGEPVFVFLSHGPQAREDKNWYMLPIEERQRQMEEHGMVGRRYAGKVQQIITGSIGFDDWEWGVDLFAAEPLVFKKLIYEMRFDQVSAEYALFGQFFIGLRVPLEKLGEWMGGKLPKHE